MGLALAVLAGCGQSMSSSNSAKVQLKGELAFTTPTPQVPSPTPSPTVVTPPPTPNNNADFMLQPLLNTGVHGDVLVTPNASGAMLQVTVWGLRPGSGHTIHDHRGTCAAANSSIHLSTIDTSAADGAGNISFSTDVPASEIEPGRIVIVYSTASPDVIVSCAAL